VIENKHRFDEEFGHLQRGARGNRKGPANRRGNNPQDQHIMQQKHGNSISEPSSGSVQPNELPNETRTNPCKHRSHRNRLPESKPRAVAKDPATTTIVEEFENNETVPTVESLLDQLTNKPSRDNQMKSTVHLTDSITQPVSARGTGDTNEPQTSAGVLSAPNQPTALVDEYHFYDTDQPSQSEAKKEQSANVEVHDYDSLFKDAGSEELGHTEFPRLSETGSFSNANRDSVDGTTEDTYRMFEGEPSE